MDPEDKSPFLSRPKVKPDLAPTPVRDDDPIQRGVDYDAVPAVAGFRPSDSANIDDSPKPTRQCTYCERSFNDDVIEKHERVCGSQKRRPKFNSKQHRLADLKDAQKQVRNTERSPRVTLSDIPVKRAGWKEKSDQLRAAVALARATDPAKRQMYEAELARVNQAVLTKCDFCGRSFNTEAAQKHIPFCRNKSMMIPRTVPGKVSLGGTGASVKLPSLNRARSEFPKASNIPKNNTRAISIRPSVSSSLRESSIIKTYFR